MAQGTRRGSVRGTPGGDGWRGGILPVFGGSSVPPSGGPAAASSPPGPLFLCHCRSPTAAPPALRAPRVIFTPQLGLSCARSPPGEALGGSGGVRGGPAPAPRAQPGPARGAKAFPRAAGRWCEGDNERGRGFITASSPRPPGLGARKAAPARPPPPRVGTGGTGGRGLSPGGHGGDVMRQGKGPRVGTTPRVRQGLCQGSSRSCRPVRTGTEARRGRAAVRGCPAPTFSLRPLFPPWFFLFSLFFFGNHVINAKRPLSLLIPAPLPPGAAAADSAPAGLPPGPRGPPRSPPKITVPSPPGGSSRTCHLEQRCPHDARVSPGVPAPQSRCRGGPGARWP